MNLRSLLNAAVSACLLNEMLEYSLLSYARYSMGLLVDNIRSLKWIMKSVRASVKP